MTDQTQTGKWTPAKFVPEDRKGLHKPNAIEWMLMVTGISLCAMGTVGVVIGLALFLGSFYSGFFVKPAVARGLYFGDCPYCGAKMSATHYQDELGCPSCQQTVRVHDNRFEVR
jgi:hypothetical protein